MSDRRHRKRRQRRRDRLIRRATPNPLRAAGARLTQHIRRVRRTKPFTTLQRFAPYKSPVSRARLPGKTPLHGTPPPTTTTPTRAQQRPGTTTSRALVTKLNDCYKRHQRRQVIHAIGRAGKGTRRDYKKWGTPCH